MKKKTVDKKTSSQLTNKRKHLVNELRGKFLTLKEKEIIECDEDDYKRVLTDDWFLKRFLISRNNKVDDALKMLCETLKWRNQENFRHLPANYFPGVFYGLGGIFSYEPDLDGNWTVYMRIKYVSKCPELNTYFKKFANKIFFDLDCDKDSKASQTGICVVLDFFETSLQNADFELIFQAIDIATRYIPYSIKKIIVVDLPWILRFGYHIIKSWIPEPGRKILKFTTRKNIRDYIAKENLPFFLNGTCTKPYEGLEVIPKTSISFLDFCQDNLGLDYKKSLEILEFYKPFLGAINIPEDKEF